MFKIFASSSVIGEQQLLKMPLSFKFSGRNSKIGGMEKEQYEDFFHLSFKNLLLGNKKIM